MRLFELFPVYWLLIFVFLQTSEDGSDELRLV